MVKRGRFDRAEILAKSTNMMRYLSLQMIFIVLCTVTLGQGILARQPCTSDSNCTDLEICRPHLCEFNVCQCKIGYTFDTNTSACEKASVVGEFCNKSVNCLPNNSECNSTSSICQCENGYHPTSDNFRCILETQKRLNEKCSNNADCGMHIGTECKKGKCSCAAGHELWNPEEKWLLLAASKYLICKNSNNSLNVCNGTTYSPAVTMKMSTPGSTIQVSTSSTNAVITASEKSNSVGLYTSGTVSGSIPLSTTTISSRSGDTSTASNMIPTSTTTSVDATASFTAVHMSLTSSTELPGTSTDSSFSTPEVSSLSATKTLSLSTPETLSVSPSESLSHSTTETLSLSTTTSVDATASFRAVHMSLTSSTGLSGTSTDSSFSTPEVSSVSATKNLSLSTPETLSLSPSEKLSHSTTETLSLSSSESLSHSTTETLSLSLSESLSHSRTETLSLSLSESSSLSTTETSSLLTLKPSPISTLETSSLTTSEISSLSTPTTNPMKTTNNGVHHSMSTTKSRQKKAQSFPLEAVVIPSTLGGLFLIVIWTVVIVGLCRRKKTRQQADTLDQSMDTDETGSRRSEVEMDTFRPTPIPRPSVVLNGSKYRPILDRLWRPSDLDPFQMHNAYEKNRDFLA